LFYKGIYIKKGDLYPVGAKFRREHQWALNLWQRIPLGDFMPDFNCPYPGGTEVLARNPDGNL